MSFSLVKVTTTEDLNTVNMSENEFAKKNTEERADPVEDTETNQNTSRLVAETGDIKQTELRSRISSVRNAKTFIKPNFKASKTEVVQPVPWPMPPKLHDKESEAEDANRVSPKREADKEYLTPQSSFAQYDDCSSQIDTSVPSESCHEASDTHSKESSVKRESFSSVGTGISLAFADSSDSGSSESVSKVDIDTDEFARFLSEKTKSSQSVVDFTQLFAEEGQERRLTENGNTSTAKEQTASEFSENSTTPKAIRAPLRYRKSINVKSNTVSLEEALEFSPDYKTIGPNSGPPVYGEANISGEQESSGLRKSEDEGVENEFGAESGLRRPMASKRKTFVLLPRPKKDNPCPGTAFEGRSQKETTQSEEKQVSTKEEGQFCNVVETTPPVKGVIMRAQSHVSHVAGIRRAETGRIMSRDELRMQKPLLFQESPNPKSLNPAGFPNEEEDVTTAQPSSIFPDSSSESDKAVNGQPSNSNLFPTTEQSSTNKKLSGSPGAAKVDDGSFLSPGILSRKKKYGTEEYRIDSFQFSEHEGSSGLLNRFSSGFRKVQLAVAKKSSHEVAHASESAIIVPGTIDEAVCKICVVCRKQLEYDVYVKDTGKKIKVESRKDGKSRHLRATILVRQRLREPSNCEVYIRQSRSDGMKTSLATLWNFYQRLETGLKEMG